MHRLALLLLCLTAACAVPTPIVIRLTPAPTRTATASPPPSRTVPPPIVTRTPRRPTATRILPQTPTPTPLRPTLPPVTPLVISTVPPNVAPAAAPVFAGTAVPQPVQTLGPNNAEQVRELARWGKGYVTAVAYAPAGRYVRVQTSVGEFFYETQTWAELAATEEMQAAFADPEALTWEEQSAAVVIKRASDGALVSTLAGVQYVGVVAFSHDKQWVAIDAGLSAAAEIAIWQVATGQKLFALEVPTPNNICDVEITTLSFSADNAWLVGGSVDSGCGYIWNMLDGSLVQYVDAEEWIVFAVGIAPDKNRLVTVQTDGIVKVWQLPEGRLLYTRNDSELLWWLTQATVAFAPDGTTFAVGLGNGEVLVYNTADGALLARLQAAAPTGEGVGFAADGRWLAVGAWHTVQVWRTDLGLRLRHNPRRFLNLAYSSAPPPNSGPRVTVIDVAIAPDGQTVVATLDNDAEHNLFFWRITAQGLDPVPPPRNFGAWDQLAFSPDGQWLAVNAFVYHTTDWHLTFNWALPRDAQASAFDAQGQTLAVLDGEGRVSVFDLSQNTQTMDTRFDPPLRTLALSPDGTTLALLTEVGFGSYTADHFNFWVDVATSAEASDAHALSAIAFSPDGQLIVTGNSNGVINLWRASDGHPLQTLSGHRGAIKSLVFSADGRFLASGASDGSVRLWGVRP